MRPTTPAWQTAVARSATLQRRSAAYAPIVCVEFLGLNRFYSTRPYAVSGPWLAGEGAVCGSGLLAGAQHSNYEQALARLDTGGLSTLQMDLDEMSDAARLSSVRVAIVQTPTSAAPLPVSGLSNTLVRLRLQFPGLTWADALSLFTGIVDRHQLTSTLLQSDLVDSRYLHQRNLSVPLGDPYFPGTPQSSRGANIPLLLGVNTDVPTFPVSGPATATLASAIASGSTSLDLVEYSAPFPSYGTISIDTETGVSYSSRSLITLLGQTYLRLSGLTRPLPGSHDAGVSVTLTDVQYHYLIGYQISSLQTVREQGVVLAPSSYQLQTVMADRPVSVLIFTTPRDTITVDVNAANIDPESLLVNGDFDTGSVAPWTASAGATASVGSALPAPLSGPYRLSLTGGLATNETLWQEVGTIPGEQYTFELFYQDSDANLFANGGFETGDLTGYTVLSSSSQSIFEVIQDNQGSADGIWYLRVRAPLVGREIHGEMSFDVTVTPGLPYSVSFAHQTFAVNYPIGGGRIWINTALRLRLGTPANPVAYAPEITVPPAFTVYTMSVLAQYARYSAPVITPTSATLRITLLFLGIEAQYGNQMVQAFPIRLDAIRVQQANVVDTSTSGYQLGTSVTPGQYATVTLGTQYKWTPARGTFVALATTSRLTLTSRYAATVTPSFFDAVRLQRVFTLHGGSGGQNPVEAIAYVISTFTTDRFDAASFRQVYQARLAWRFGAVLSHPGDSAALLARMAAQCFCVLVRNQDGVYRLVSLESTRPSVGPFDTSNLVSFQIEPAPIDNVYSAFYVWFGAKTGGASSAADFAGLTYATPQSTTHPTDLTLSGACAAAQTVYGREHRLDVYADCIQDLATANLLLQALVVRRTVRQSVLTLTTWLDALPYELGDVVEVQHPTLPASPTPWRSEVVGWALDFQRMLVTLRLSTVTASGWLAPFDYMPSVFTEPLYAAPFEA